uniref:DNA-directed DNA polymerase family A palm domain-containing protein n=1 Tax=Lynx canadensis TaxID=61383 RepID=A0A667H462_LYNCA
MENYEAFVGFDPCKIPLSSVAQKIMSAVYSGDLVESKHWRGVKRVTVEVVNKSCIKCSVLLEDGKNQSLEKRVNHCKSLSSALRCQTHGPAVCWPRRKSSSSPLPPRCLPPPWKQEASVLQKMGWKRKQFLKEDIGNEKRESMNLKGKHSPRDFSGRTSKRVASEEDAAEVKAYLNSKSQVIEMLQEAEALVVTPMYEDGWTQLRVAQALISPVKGIVVSLQSRAVGSGPLDIPASDGAPGGSLHTQSFFPRSEVRKSVNWFSSPRKVLFHTVKCKCPVICFNAKDFVRTVLQFFGNDGVVHFVGLDPRIAARLIDPEDATPSFEDLVAKYLESAVSVPVSSTYGNSSRNVVNVRVNLKILYRLTMGLCSQLKVYGLWQLFCTLELPLIPVLAVMESHSIRVNGEEMERTSALLGSRLKESEQEAHFVAGERFLKTSNNQLREVKLIFFNKIYFLGMLKLNEGITLVTFLLLFQLNALQDLHLLPKIILEYRRVSYLSTEGSISCTWNQTGTVTGRLSARRSNIQGISKHPIRITKPQYFKGNLFLSTFVDSYLTDFSQIELRILAHLSGDPELWKLFRESEKDDVFSTLTSLTGNHGVSHGLFVSASRPASPPCDAGYVASIVGRRRPLPRVHTQDQRLRARAERQAVNFVAPGTRSASAHPLCACASWVLAVATSPTLSPRLVAQIHDELLFEVEGPQVPACAGRSGRHMAVLVQGQLQQLPLVGTQGHFLPRGARSHLLPLRST